MAHEDSDDDYIPEPDEEIAEKSRAKREKPRQKHETEKPPKLRKLTPQRQPQSNPSTSVTTRSSQKKNKK